MILLEHRTRSLTLTTAGHRVYEQCLSIERETERLYGLLGPQSGSRGVLCLGVLQSLSEITLLAVLSVLSQQFPRLLPQITCGWGGQLQRWLKNGELDGMLAIRPARQSFVGDYSGHLLYLLEVVSTVGRRLDLRMSSLREYAGQDWTLNPDGCSLRARLVHEL